MCSSDLSDTPLEQPTFAYAPLGKGAVHFADGMLICLEEGSGTVALVEASPKAWTERGRFKLAPQTEKRNPKGKVWTHPVVLDGKLYLRDQELAGLDIVTDGDCRFDDDVGGQSWTAYPPMHMAGFERNNPRPTPVGRGGIAFPRGHILHDYLESRVMPVITGPIGRGNLQYTAMWKAAQRFTDKPVKYLVDTHFHIDHAYGNAALPSDVQIIGHDFTRKALTGSEAREGVTFKNFTTPMPGRIETLKQQVAAETDAAKKATLQQQLAAAEATLAVTIMPPGEGIRVELVEEERLAAGKQRRRQPSHGKLRL